MCGRRVPLVAIVPKAYYDVLSAVGKVFLERLQDNPEDNDQYRMVRQALEDWKQWDDDEKYMIKA